MPVRGKGSMSGYFKGVDKKMAHIILDEIIDSGPCVRFNHIGKKKCNRFFFMLMSDPSTGMWPGN